MINHNTIQEFIITKLKADTDLVNLLGGVDTEIREADWAGRDFTYPCVRVKTGPQREINGGCSFEADIRITCFVTDTNDKALHDISYRVSQIFDNKAFGNRRTQNVSMSQSIKDISVWRQNVQIRLQATK